MTVVIWDAMSGDWARDDGRSSELLAAVVVDQAEPGQVVLLHDDVERTAIALPLILRELGDRGYDFEPLPPGTTLLRTPTELLSRDLS